MKAQENQVNPSSERLSAILAELTTDQIRYIVARQDVATDKRAAENVGISPDTVSRWKRDEVAIDEAVRLMAFDGLVMALHIRQRNLAKAMAVKVAGLNSNEERTRQSVATEIIEWEIGKARQKTEISGRDGGPIETKDVSLTDEERAQRVVALFNAAATKRDSTTP